MKTYALEPVKSSQKSFYGKARVIIEDDGTKNLISYDTHVATIHTLLEAEIYGTYSKTTLIHIKDFLYQNNFPIGTKEELIHMYMKCEDCMKKKRNPGLSVCGPCYHKRITGTSYD